MKSEQLELGIDTTPIGDRYMGFIDADSIPEAIDNEREKSLVFITPHLSMVIYAFLEDGEWITQVHIIININVAGVGCGTSVFSLAKGEGRNMVYTSKEEAIQDGLKYSIDFLKDEYAAEHRQHYGKKQRKEMERLHVLNLEFVKTLVALVA